VAAIADFLYAHGANILHSDQHQDNEVGMLFMRGGMVTRWI
jgi:formyltetrahydrofolate deformylase